MKKNVKDDIWDQIDEITRLQDFKIVFVKIRGK